MKYVCSVCGYVYDEAAGKAWDSLPEDWKCPLCGASKAEFRPEGEEKPKAAVIPAPAAEELRPLSHTELSIICSNLARGCEKQYKAEEAKAFAALAGWFAEGSEKPSDPSFSAILEKIEQDLQQNFPAASAVSSENGDRGALRSLVWSEKVTRMLSSLLKRYPNGEELPEGTGVYVCTVCGFVYAGDELPAVCPVCKVPNRKFERIGG